MTIADVIPCGIQTIFGSTWFASFLFASTFRRFPALFSPI